MKNIEGAKLVGRKVAGIDGPGYSVAYPAHSGTIEGHEETRWGPMVQVLWEDGTREGFSVQSLQEVESSSQGAIGVYLLPE